MKIVFLGSPKEALAPLELLFANQARWNCELVGVVSQPARPAGRNRKLTDPPVAEFAKQHGIPVLQPEKARDEEFLMAFQSWQPDVAVTVAYGQILTDTFLKIPKRGTINIHPSLLPKYRGAIPVPAALLNGDTTTGVSILFTVRELDAGNLITQQETKILENETAEQLTLRMFQLGGALLENALVKLRDPFFSGNPQDPALVTHCKKIRKEDGEINWSLSAKEIVQRFQAYFPWPGSFTVVGDKPIVFTQVRLNTSAMAQRLSPGEFAFVKALKAIAVGTSEGELLVDRLTPAGSKEQDAAAFWNGIGQKLESKRFGSQR